MPISFYFLPGGKLQIEKEFTSEKVNSLTFKNNYIVIVEVEDFLLLSDALSRALDLVNKKLSLEPNSSGVRLVDDLTKYCLRIAKKTGLPNLDFPTLLLTSQIKNCKFERISVSFNETHLINKNSFSSDSSQDKMTHFVKESSDENFISVSKKKCCQDKCTIF